MNTSLVIMFTCYENEKKREKARINVSKDADGLFFIIREGKEAPKPRYGY